MESIGHDTTAINEKALLTKMVKNDDPRIHLFEKYISLEKCLIVCSEAMSAERHSKFGSYPDHQTRLKAVESASRIAGYVQPDQTNINIVVLNALEDLKNELGTVEIN